MKKFVFFIPILLSLSFGQPKESIEFQLNTISGVVLNSTDASPVIQLNVKILSGNNLVKDSTITDDNGYFIIENVGYVWKPKVRFSLKNYQSITLKLTPQDLDSLNNMIIGQVVSPVPDNQTIPTLSQSKIESRAETFFIKGNVFYYLLPTYDGISAEMIIIDSYEAIENEDSYLFVNVNDNIYDPVRCYIPQMGKYENLSCVMKGYFDTPLFEQSGHPQFLPDNLLRPSVIYGTVINTKTGETVMGAEVMLKGLFKRRISDEHGKFAFQVDKPGIYEVMIDPPFGFKKNRIGLSSIKVREAKGGWYRSNQYLEP
tara:strand:- start:209 stop:1153 length:945 start_codon:yes stop_codon:yes gene_type:complete